MKEFKYVITDEMGIHARPAGLLVKAVKGCGSTVKITKGERTVDCKGVMGVMSLGAKKDDEVTLTFDGADEDAAYEAISKFMQENL